MAQREGSRAGWSTKKKVKAERGLSQGRDGQWAIAYACSLRHIHRERVDTVKGNARALLAARRTAAQRDATWCPRLERQRALAAQRDAEAHEATRVPFADWCTEWLAWAKLHHKGYATDVSRVTLLSRTFGPLRLDEITTAGVETGIVDASRRLPHALLVVAPPLALFGLLILPVAMAVQWLVRRQFGRPGPPVRIRQSRTLRRRRPAAFSQPWHLLTRMPSACDNMLLPKSNRPERNGTSPAGVTCTAP